MSIKLSAVVIAKNEQDLLAACLESLHWVDEIVVMNNESTDDTEKIAHKYTEKVFLVKGTDFTVIRNQAFSHTTGQWVLYVDADERVLKPLRKEILQLIEEDGGPSAYALSRKNIMYGQQVSYGPYQKDWMIRLFRRQDFETWVGTIHEYAKFKGELGYSKNSLLHLTHRDLDHVVIKTLAWSKIYAKLLKDSGHPKMVGWRFIRILMSEIWLQGFVRKGEN